MSGNGTAVARSGGTVKSLLESRREEFAKALAGRVDPDAFVRVAFATITKTPQLLQCSQASLLMSLLECASLGLQPNSVMGEAYIIPYGKTAQFIPGFRGLAKLARQSGEVTNVIARLVREGDDFEVVMGTEEKLVHKPAFGKDERPMTHVYAVAYFRDGPPQFDVMERWEVDRIRAKSKSGRSGPWVSDYDEMAKKTVLRRLAKHLPLSDTDFHKALEADNRDYDMSAHVGGGAVSDLNSALAEDGPVQDAEVVEDDGQHTELDELGLTGELPCPDCGRGPANCAC